MCKRVTRRPIRIDAKELNVMDYLVDFTIEVPAGTPASELERRTAAEGARVAELAAQGRALRVWKPLPDDGRRRAIGLYRADDDRELQAILDSLPLRSWMEIAVTALAEHPSDPALVERASLVTDGAARA
ncbi:MAG: hypothetical protein QOI71_1304, partial [Gaiellales bacterium]|nr:hypothetical protein [Gaiellales bacterium]